MSDDRWQRVKTVVADALEKETAVRSAYVARACADDTTLRREVESMLAHKSTRFDECADDLSAALKAGGESRVGERIGAYEIIREIGRGGMGAVFLGRRADENFDRLVAIKILKRGTDTDEVLRRFRAERRILARLDHPNIARLLDAGTTDDGLPYFVMEHIAGERVTDYCELRRLPVAERLRLFLKICAAVRFAHQNLVVHRDLKPANILVTAEGEPKLLDFGIAKLIEADSGTAEVTLGPSQRFTAAYASPEQVRGEPVTTLSDVYALGALLYEMVAGRSPHKFSSNAPAFAEVQRVVVEEEPGKPSDAAADPAVRRALRGDVDNIVLKALRKEPAARYGGVGALAEDIRRHLEARPVRARPPTLRYRAGKFISRNRRSVLAATLLGLAIALAVAISLWQSQRAAWHARRAARHFNDLRQLANSFLFEFHDAVAPLPGSTPLRHLIVQRALRYLDQLSREAADDPGLQLELATAYVKVAEVQGKPYTPNLGDAAGAMRSYNAAIQIAGPLSTKTGERSATRALEILASAHAGLAAVEARANDQAGARANNLAALQLAERLVVLAPHGADRWRRIVEDCEIGIGDSIEAGNHHREDPALFRETLVHYRRAHEVSEQLLARQPDAVDQVRRTAKSCARVAVILAELGEHTADARAFEEAFSLHARALELQEKAAALEPTNAQIRRNVADELVMMAYAQTLAGRDLDGAAEKCARALSIEERLAAADPSNAEAKQDLNFAHYVSGRVAQLRGDLPAARDHFRACIRILEPLVAAHPDNVETAFDMDRARQRLKEVE